MTATEIQLLRDIAAYLRTLPPTTTNAALLARINTALGIAPADIPPTSRIATDVPMRI